MAAKLPNSAGTTHFLTAGESAPEFTLHSTPDQQVSLGDFRGQPVVLVFYPADWSPVCGGGPPPHRHDFEESFTLLDGEIEASFRGRTLVVRAGETLHIPANALHSFTNASDRPVRLLCLCAPAGQEEFFQQVGVPVADRTTPPPRLDKAAQTAAMKKAASLAPKYRSELLSPEKE